MVISRLIVPAFIFPDRSIIRLVDNFAAGAGNLLTKIIFYCSNLSTLRSVSAEWTSRLQGRFFYARNSVPMSKKHPGFKAVQAKVEREGYSKKEAGAIVAGAARHAGSAAKKANPNLKKVK